MVKPRNFAHWGYAPEMGGAKFLFPQAAGQKQRLFRVEGFMRSAMLSLSGEDVRVTVKSPQAKGVIVTPDPDQQTQLTRGEDRESH